MCRLLVVKSTVPILLAEFLTKPSHSIIHQAIDSRLRLDQGAVNADGAGISWYPADEMDGDNKPCIFKMITPAWSSQNLHRLADKIKSPLFFAHIRASTTGSLSDENCHPWGFGNLLWQHNGMIAGFRQILRRLQADLSDEFFDFPAGSTDSEYAFALFLQLLSAHIDPRSRTIPRAILHKTMLETIARINSYTEAIGAKEPSLMNFCVTDGVTVVVTRYISSRTEEAASLFFSTGSTFEASEDGGQFRMRKADRRENVIVVASEPLTFERADWIEVPSQTCLVITERMNVLQIPIEDAYSSGRHPRRDGFAQRKGFRFIPAEVTKDLREGETVHAL